MRKIVFALVIMSISIVGCGRNNIKEVVQGPQHTNGAAQDIQETNAVINNGGLIELHEEELSSSEREELCNIDMSIKVAELNEKEILYYGNRGSIFIMSGDECTVLNKWYGAYPEISPDKKKIAYIDAVGFEIIGNICIYDINSKRNLQVTNYCYGQNDTAKVIKWLDNKYILAIIGFGFGTVSQGGSLYVYDTQTDKLSLLITPEKKTEIKDFTLLEDKIIFNIVRWTDEIMNNHIIETKEMSLHELMSLIETK